MNSGKQTAQHGDVTDEELREILERHQDWIATEGAEGARADLSGVVDLMGGRLARANLAGAIMPPHLQRFREIIHVDKTVDIARPLYIVLLLLCCYTIMVVISSSDLNVITNRPIQLIPESALGVPTSGFLKVSSIFILSVYAYVHIYLYRLWQILGQLPSVFHDGTALDQAISPWLVTAHVRFYQTHGVDKPSVLGIAQKWVTILLVWWLAPITLVLIWARYLVRHDWEGTWLHVVLVAIAVLSAILLKRFAKAGLCNQAKPLESRRGQALGFGALLATVAVLFFLSNAAMNSQRKEFSVRDPSTWMTTVLGLVNMPPCADLRRANLSGADLSNIDLRCANLVEANLGYSDPVERDGAANLYGADLRGADLTRAILSGADLRTARLDYARLGNANLERAQLSNSALISANFDGANLCHANLGSANFENGRLSGAILYQVDLSNANLRHVDLSDADLTKAILSGADLRDAELAHALFSEATLLRTNLEGADTVGTVFDRTDLKDTVGMTQDQLDNACAQGKRYPPLGSVIGWCPDPFEERKPNPTCQ